MPALHRRARRLIRNREDSEDALQDALLSAFRHLDQFQGKAQFSTWLQTILLNSARNLLRKQRARPGWFVSIAGDGDDFDPETMARLADREASPEEQCIRSESLQTLAKILNDVPVKYRGIICMYELEELRTHEIAELLGIRVGTVKSRLHRARNLIVRQVQGVENAPARLSPRATTTRPKGRRRVPIKSGWHTEELRRGYAARKLV
jgi:RNA polymerase sigma-70 factor (ECF subfamily)